MHLKLLGKEEPKKLNPLDLTYNGEMPKDFYIITFVWVSNTKEYFNDITHVMHPDCATADWISDCIIEFVIDEIGAALPDKGVWRVVASGSVSDASGWTDCGYEYDSSFDWDIISANKFFSFGDLKHFWKEHKPVTAEIKNDVR